MHHLWMMKAATVLFGVDMAAKQYIEETMESGQEKTIGDTKIVLRKVYNKGFMLNLMDDRPDLVKMVTVATGLGLLAEDTWIFSEKGRCLEKAGMALTSAGAASNIFDRLVRGKVIDYIGCQTENSFLAKVTANLGDFYIAAGMCLAAVGRIFRRKKNKIS